MRARKAFGCFAGWCCVFGLEAGWAQQRGVLNLTLEDAVRIAAEESEQVGIARAGLMRARGEQVRARSEYFPQIFGSAGYTRTLRSEFSGVAGNDSTEAPESEPCASFSPNPALPLTERIDSLELAVQCQSRQSEFDIGGLFENLPFGRVNQWNFGVQASQAIPVLGGSRIRSQVEIARAGRSVMETELRSARAQVVLEITQAYYDALLAGRLLAIAEAMLGQADTTFVQVRLAAEIGDQPEFELLRAQVSRDNQRPVVIQRRAERDLALIRLKQLLNIPLNEAVALTSDLGDGQATTRDVSVSEPGDTAASARAAVLQAGENVKTQELLGAIARTQRLPSITLNSQYGRVAYPEGVLPSLSDFRSNWTVGAALQIPLFTGGRIRADEMVAAANLAEARARYNQTREYAALDAREAVERLRAAEAVWVASAGTVEQAERAATIARVRYTEGVSTQLELTDARIMSQQAQANRAIAMRDVQVARVRVALLADLPIGAGQSGGSIQNGDSSSMQQQQMRPSGQPDPNASTSSTASRSQASVVSN